jgi:signal transduction histidine kinase/CheY-like chemotaxis protein
MSDSRLEPVFELMTRLAGGDLEARGEMLGDDEVVDALIGGLNMLAEELFAEHAARMQAEAMLHDEVDAYDRAPGLFCTLSPDDLTIIKCNRTLAKALAMSPESLLGRSLESLCYDESPDRASLLESLLSGEEVTLRTSAGAPLVVSTNAKRVEEPAPRVRVVWRDITKERDLEAQLLQAQKMEAIGRLSGGIAHDFNNILTVVQSSASLLVEDYPHVDRGDIGMILDASQRGAALTNQLLAFSRKQIVQPKPVELSRMVRDVAPMIRRTLGDLELRLKLTRVVAMVDPSKLTQVLLNLVINARDAMPDGGRVAIEVSHDDEWATLSVLDTGEGMSADTHARAFEPFFTTKEVGKGTGLGLATSYGIIRQAGGDIVIDSEPGAGTSISVRLPRAAEELPERTAGTRTIERGSERLLLVEDDHTLRPLTKRVLERAGYQVTAVENGAEALKLLESAAPFELIVSDIVMPTMSGPELMDELARRGMKTRTLFMTGYSPQSISADARLLRKPFRPAELLEAVRAALDE